MRTEQAKQRALASAPPVGTYAAADQGEVEEYFAPGRYARYERSTVFAQTQNGTCVLLRVDQVKVQIAQGTRLVNAISKNAVTTVSDVALRPVPQWAPGASAFSSGTVTQVGEKTVAGEGCDLMSSAAPTFGTVIELCVWRGIKTFLTPLGPKEIVLFLEAKPVPVATSMLVTDPIVLNTAEILHWTEEATEFRLNDTFADTIFTAPQPTK